MTKNEEPLWINYHEIEGNVLFGLVSDTHIPEARQTLYDELYEENRVRLDFRQATLDLIEAERVNPTWHQAM